MTGIMQIQDIACMRRGEVVVMFSINIRRFFGLKLLMSHKKINILISFLFYCISVMAVQLFICILQLHFFKGNLSGVVRLDLYFVFLSTCACQTNPFN